MHKKLSEKLGAKFPAITRGYSMVKFAHLDDPFFEGFNCKQAHWKTDHCSKKKRKEKGKKEKRKIILKIQKPNLERRRSLYFSCLKILISSHA